MIGFDWISFAHKSFTALTLTEQGQDNKYLEHFASSLPVQSNHGLCLQCEVASVNKTMFCQTIAFYCIFRDSLSKPWHTVTLPKPYCLLIQRYFHFFIWKWYLCLSTTIYTVRLFKRLFAFPLEMLLIKEEVVFSQES